MRKQYIAPEFVIIDIDATDVICDSQITETEVYEEGTHSAGATSYRSSLWN